MLNGKGDLKVADFGIARSLSDSVSMLTMARGTSGTLAYMSPQQLDGERASNLDDIYSLGATLYELLTSKPPFHSGGIERLIREKTPSSLAAKRDELDVSSDHRIPEQWEQTIAACLAKDGAARPQSSLEVRDRLRAPARPLPTTPPPPPTASLPITPSPVMATRVDEIPTIRKLPPYLTNRVLMGSAAVVLVIAGGAVWWFRSSQQTNIEPTSILPATSPRAVVVSPTPPSIIRSPTPEETLQPTPRNEASPSPTISAKNEGEEIETMVTTQIDAGTRGDVAASMALYADTVDFLDEGLKSREAIAKDLPGYFAHWPVRRSELVGEISIETLGETERKVGYTIDFEASNPATGASRKNRVSVTWIIRRDGPWSPFKIVSHKQTRAIPETVAEPSDTDGAIATVKSYFAAVNNHDGAAAYRLFGANYHKRASFEQYLQLLKKSGTLTLNSISRTASTNSSATVEVTFEEVEPGGKVILWHGPIKLVVESGEWRIDTLRGLKSNR
jgi:ketosteroid isomerase-like protein